MDTQVILFYKYVNLPEPTAEVAAQKKLCQELSLVGRVLIGEEGINGTLDGSPENIQKYQDYISNHKYLSGIVFKSSPTTTSAFSKLKVKYRPEIVTLNHKVDLKNTGKRISPEELHSELEKKSDLVLIDMRNDYESAIGRFQNAVLAETENFRDLPEKIASLGQYKNKKVVTYCTGGIRCEKASALLVESGFKDVSQLDGGIFKYAEKYPDGFFEGKCFVFDQRMSVNFEKNRETILTFCEHCQEKSDTYTDCADNSCHRLFICCQNCQKKFKNFCTFNHENLTIQKEQSLISANF